MKETSKFLIALGVGTVAVFGLSKLAIGRTATLSGFITDSASGDVIVGADVRVHDFDIPPSGHYSIDKSTKSNSEGKYSFTIALDSIYVPEDWVGDGRSVAVEAIAFTYSGNGANLIIFEGDNICNIVLNH